MSGTPIDSLGVLYVARHGETEWNRLGRRQGRLDSALTVAGRQQTARVGDAGANAGGVHEILTSPLGRAARTAQICANRLRAPVRVVDDLAELDHGEMSGLTRAQVDQRFPGALTARARDKYRWRFPNGESYADAERRVRQVIDSLPAGEEFPALIISHEMIGRVLVRQLLGLSVDEAMTWTHPHDVVYRIGLATKARSTITV